MLLLSDTSFLRNLYWPLEIRKEFHFHAQENIKMDRHIYKLTQEILPTSAGSLFWFRPVFHEQCQGILQSFPKLPQIPWQINLATCSCPAAASGTCESISVFKSALEVESRTMLECYNTGIVAVLQYWNLTISDGYRRLPKEASFWLRSEGRAGVSKSMRG